MSKKYFIFLILFCSNIFAQEQDKNKWLVGLGYQINELPYKQMDKEKKVIPIIRYEGTKIYWHTLELGYKLHKKEDSTYALALKARLDSYKSEDSIYFEGMENKKKTLEFGIRKYSYLSKKDIISYSLFHDIAKKHKGYELVFEYKHIYMIPKTFISPYFKAEYLSNKLVDYYYGVTSEEETSSRNKYDANFATNLSLGVQIKTKISNKTMLMLDYSYKKLDGTITQSPLVDQSSQKKFMTNMLYRF